MAPVRSSLIAMALVCLMGVVSGTPAGAEGKAQVYLLRLEPTSRDAKKYARASWGGGLNVVVPVPASGNLIAGVAGFDVARLLSQRFDFYELSGLRVEQHTDQDYFRIYLGGRIGPHGPGFIRPHVGTNLALVLNHIGTDVVVPDDYDRENEIRQQLRDETKAALGWDITVGVDWNIANRFPVETGVRFLKTFNAPQQLGADAVTVHPAYVQVYVGIGASFGLLRDL
jgi:hypothetical protein